MFVQTISGTVTDPEAFQRQVDLWETDLRPGATGFLGSTGGVTPDGKFVVLARFESEDAARANSDRPEQGSWWAELEKTVSDVAFKDSVEVKPQGKGGSDGAGFVQIMRGRVKDDEKLAVLEAKMNELDAAMSAMRPDVLGGLIVRHADDTYTNAVYFTSETAARAAEGQEPSAEMQEMFATMDAAITIDEYLDLPNPMLR